MKFAAGNFELSLNFIPVIAMLAGVLLFSSLGLWQLDRAGLKRSRHELLLTRQDLPPISPEDPVLSGESGNEFLWRRINLSGSFAREKTVMLDNQVMNGTAGYFVYNAFAPENSNYLMLVNRGWLPAGDNRARVNGLEIVPGKVNLSGLIKEFPKSGLVLKQTGPERLNDQLFRVQSLDHALAERIFSASLFPYVVRLQPESAHGYARNWHDPGSGEKMHLGYAFQWFAMAGAALIIFIVLNLKSKPRPVPG